MNWVDEDSFSSDARSGGCWRERPEVIVEGRPACGIGNTFVEEKASTTEDDTITDRMDIRSMKDMGAEVW